MRRGTINITEHAITRYQQRAGMKIPIPEVKRLLQQIYDKGKFLLIKESNDKSYVYNGWVIVIKDLTITTCYMPPIKEIKNKTHYWINRNWISI